MPPMRKDGKPYKRGGTVTLDERQERFCREYVRLHGNIAEAAKIAGYLTERTSVGGYAYGPRLIRKPIIAKRIRELEEEAAVYAGATTHWVIKELMRVGRAAELAGEFGAAVRALENIGRHLAMFVDKVNVKGQLDMNVSVTMRNEIVIEEVFDGTSDLAVGPSGITAGNPQTLPVPAADHDGA